MKDIFDAKISCKVCDLEMQPIMIERSGCKLRAMNCPSCQEKIIHPQDLNNFNHYNSLKEKTYIVKLRIVGNSHTVSIPKEIVDFIHESNNINKRVNEAVKLCFEDFGRLSLIFIDNSGNYNRNSPNSLMDNSEKQMIQSTELSITKREA